MKAILSRIIQRKGLVRDAGLTLVEIVVALALVAVVAAFATSTLLNTTQTSQNFNQGVANENNLVDAVSKMSRDISLATEFKYAGTNSLALNTNDEGVINNVFYFVWDGNANSIPNDSAFAQVRANSGKLPQDKGLVEYRVINGDNADPVIRTVVAGYTGNSQTFTYFRSSNDEISFDSSTTPPSVAKDELKGIRRVEMNFKTTTSSRKNAMEMHTSAVPRILGITARSMSSNVKPNENPSEYLAAPVINGDLPPQTNSSKLWWASIGGAEDYTVFGQKNSKGSWTVLGTVPQKSGTVTFDQKGLEWGADYSYSVVANDFRGPSADSNTVTMRVTPEPSAFINSTNKKAEISTTTGGSTTYNTVARNLNNGLAWKKSAGANNRYSIYQNTNDTSKNTTTGYSIPAGMDNTTNSNAVHTARNYGFITSYKVRASNPTVTLNNPDGSVKITGGAAKDSAVVSLVSPPIAPIVSATDYSDLRVPSGDSVNNWTGKNPQNWVTVNNHGTIKNATSVNFWKNNKDAYVTTAKTASVDYAQGQLWKGGIPATEANKGWGSTLYYYATASNDAGSSPNSNRAKVEQYPGPYAITKLDNTEGYSNLTSNNVNIRAGATLQLKKGKIVSSYSKSLGNGGYTLSRTLRNGMPSTIKDPTDSVNRKRSISTVSGTTGNATSSAMTVEGVSPGSIYDFTIVAKSSSNAKTRTVKSNILTRPEPPQKGIAEAVCYGTNAQGSKALLGSYAKVEKKPRRGLGDKMIVKITTAKSKVNLTKTFLTLSSNTPIFQKQSGIQDDTVYSFTNEISYDAMPKNATAFGQDAPSRRSSTQKVSIGYSYTFKAGCRYDKDYRGPEADGNSVAGLKAGQMNKNAKPWVVHPFVCYGIPTPHPSYGSYYVHKNRPFWAGYKGKDPNYSGAQVKKYSIIPSDGCIWRFDPTRGQKPEFFSW